MIVQRRRWCPLWVGAVSALVTAGLIAVAMQLRLRDQLSMLPLLFTGVHLSLTLLFNYTTATITEAGVSIHEGVIPSGFRDRRLAREEVAGVLWRYEFGAPRSGEEPYWAVVIATRQGDWVDLPQRFEAEMFAQQEAVRVAAVLGMKQISRAEGLPPRRDFRTIWALFYWIGLMILCLILPALWY